MYSMRLIHKNIVNKFLVLTASLFLLQGCETYEGASLYESDSIFSYDPWAVSGWDEPEKNIFEKVSPQTFNFPENHDTSLNTWVCATYNGTGMIALVQNADKSYILMDDLQIDAYMQLDGLNRRWDWNSGENTIILKPRGSAAYYDFNGEKTATASAIFDCEKYKVEGTQKIKAKHENIENWRKLKLGMSRDQVKEILGEPLTIETGYWIRWYYNDNRLHSKIEFYDK